MNKKKKKIRSARKTGQNGRPVNERRSLGKSRKARAGEIAEPATPLRNYNLRQKEEILLPRISAREATFLFSLPPSPSSFSSLLPSAGLSSHGTLDREQLPGLSKIHRERVSVFRRPAEAQGNSRKIVVPSRSARLNFGRRRTRVVSRVFTSLPSWKPRGRSSALSLPPPLSFWTSCHREVART